MALEMWRDPLRARFTGRHRLDSHALVHPFLALAAATAAHWLDREAFHAGAFRLGDEAFAVLGEKDAGKSTAMCHLATRGIDVLADDLVVLENGDVLAGPNSIDLRPGAAHRLGVGKNLGMIGARERWRVITGVSEPRTRLAGWITLRWGATVELRKIPATNLLATLLASTTLRLPTRDPERMLALAALPAYELRRPQRWEALDSASTLLIEHLEGNNGGNYAIRSLR